MIPERADGPERPRVVDSAQCIGYDKDSEAASARSVPRVLVDWREGENVNARKTAISGVFALLLALALAVPPARAEHAKITLEVAAPGGQQTAYMDQTPPDWGKNPRPVVKARVGASIKIQWMFINVYPHKTLENIVVHFFIARESKAGQKELPELTGDNEVVLESAFDMDFKPGGKAGQRQTVRIDAPGVYLIRVESKNTQSDHEHFAAIDLVVEGN
jgi:hypothetical protein